MDKMVKTVVICHLNDTIRKLKKEKENLEKDLNNLDEKITKVDGEIDDLKDAVDIVQSITEEN